MSLIIMLNKVEALLIGNAFKPWSEMLDSSITHDCRDNDCLLTTNCTLYWCVTICLHYDCLHHLPSYVVVHTMCYDSECFAVICTYTVHVLPALLKPHFPLLASGHRFNDIQYADSALSDFQSLIIAERANEMTANFFTRANHHLQVLNVSNDHMLLSCYFLQVKPTSMHIRSLFCTFKSCFWQANLKLWVS